MSFKIGDRVEHVDQEANWDLFNGKVIDKHGAIDGDVYTIRWYESGHSRPLNHKAEELRLKRMT